MKELSKRLTLYRKQRKMKMVEVALQLGIPVSTYRDWEYGREIKGEPYVKLAQIFNISLTELLTGEPAVTRKVFEDVKNLEFALEELKNSVASL